LIFNFDLLRVWPNVAWFRSGVSSPLKDDINFASLPTAEPKSFSSKSPSTSHPESKVTHSPCRFRKLTPLGYFQLGCTSELCTMAFQATVIAPISLKPGTNIDEGEGAQMLTYGLKTISEQPGFQDCFYGLQHERPDMLDLLIGSLLLNHSHPDQNIQPTCSQGL